MKKIIIFLVLTLTLVSWGGAQSLFPCQDCDTIPSRYSRYYYSEWYDSCSTFLNPEIDSCYIYYFGLSSDNGTAKKPFHTDGPLTIKGLTALVDIHAGGAIFADTTKLPEYLFLYQDIGKDCFVKLDSVRWDTAKPHYMRFPTDYMDTMAEYCYAYDAYFDHPIEVDSTFYIWGSNNSNIWEGIMYEHIPTFYSYAKRWVRRTAPDCWAASYAPLCYPTLLSKLNHYGWNRDTCYFVSNTRWGHFLPIISALRLDLYSDSLQMGSVLGAGRYPEDEPVTFRAVPQSGYKFSHWNDGNTDNPRTVMLHSDTSFTAFFDTLSHYRMSLSSNDSSWGLAQASCLLPSPMPGLFPELTNITLTASTVDTQAVFVRWDDGNTDNPRTVVLNSDTSFTALFDTLTHYHLELLVNNPDWGETHGSGYHLEQRPVTIVATPRIPEASFVGWDDGVADSLRTVVLSGDTSLTAIFSYDSTGIGTGVEGLENDALGLRVSPNPVRHVLRVQCSVELEGVLEVYDAEGRMVMVVPMEGREARLDVSRLAVGQYVLRAKGKMGTAQRKFVRR